MFHISLRFSQLLSGFVILAFFLIKGLQADIYVWTDENGNKVFGDEPQKSDQAKPLQLEATTILSFPKLEFETNNNTQQNNVQAYSQLLITSPIDDATVRDNSGTVSVALSSEPALVEGHKIQIYLDGSAYQSPQASTSFTLSNIDRGTHTLSASILSESGETLFQSKALSFHLHRGSLKK